MNFKKPDYTYKVIKISKEVSADHESPKVIDGDTVDVLIDLGFYSTTHKRIRMLDIDTDELRGGTKQTKERAKAAKLRLKDLFTQGELYIRTEMDATGKYGRLLGTFFIIKEDGTVVNINKALVDEGFQKGSQNTQIVVEWIKKIFS